MQRGSPRLSVSGPDVDCWLRSEGVAPAEAGEAAEVGVVGVKFGLIFDGEGRDVGVGGQVASDAGGLKRVAYEGEVMPAGVLGSDVG